MSEDALKLEDLGHAYGGGAPVLSGVSMRLRPGALMAVLGVSGSGKSTLLRAAAGFVTPTEGQISLGGRLVCAGGREIVPPERRGVGMVFQDYALFPHMTVAQNVAFGLAKGPARAARVRDMLAKVGLEDLRGRRPAALSGGQQQRVALARALAPGPALLLLDEPFANLDAALRMRLGAEIRDLLADLTDGPGVGAMLVTHDREEALGLADVVAVLGPPTPGAPATLLQLDTPEVVYSRPVSPAVAALTGEAAFVDGEAAGGRAETALGALAVAPDQRGPLTLIIRPEQLRFQPGEGPCVIRRRRFQGARYHLDLQTPAGPLSVELPAAALGDLDPTLALARGATGRLLVEGRCAAVTRR